MKSFLSLVAAFSVAATPVLSAPKVCASCVKANMERLAGDDLRGRGCGTADENAAARFVAERLKAYKVAGALADGAYLQPVEYSIPTYASPPVLDVGVRRFTQGREMVALDPQAQAEGVLFRMGKLDPPESAAGKIVIAEAYDAAFAAAVFRAGAVAVIAQASERTAKAFDQLAIRPPAPPVIKGVEEAGPPRPARPTVFATAEAFAALRALDGQAARLSAPRGEPLARTTYNVLGVIHGTAPDADRQAILLSAHYDHMGVINGVTYHGANDDASGTAAVLEFARLLGAGARPKRTVQFALFGCEEQGGHGARYYLAHPPAPLTDLAANLEFEMIGYVDPKYPDALMLTGWERSNLGPTLAAHGAKIGPDHYPEEGFFQRSDNIQLARKGVVAQTVSAWPVPPTYHQPTDTLANLDMAFMVKVIQSMAEPIDWLLNSDFRPEWNPGMKP